MRIIKMKLVKNARLSLTYELPSKNVGILLGWYDQQGKKLSFNFNGESTQFTAIHEIKYYKQFFNRLFKEIEKLEES